MPPTPLTAEQRAALATAHPDWSATGEALQRTLVFADFAEAMGFVNRVALIAQALDHHPDIDIRWNQVTLHLTTHSVGALTDFDLALVQRIDAFLG